MADDIQSRRDRVEGRARSGTVGLRAFDEGVVRTMRPVLVEAAEGVGGNYFLQIPGMNNAPGEPGVPIIFSFPEDMHEKFKIPAITVMREDMAPAMQRWHPGSLQYRAPAAGALPVVVGAQTGFNRYEELQQAVPFDITYALVLYARNRVQGNYLLDYVMRIYPPYCNVKVQDSLGDYRLYSAWTEGIGMLDDVPEVGDRVIAFAVTLRVEAELDLNDPVTYAAVTVGAATTRIEGI